VSGVGPSSVIGSDVAGTLACEVRDFNPQTWLGNKGIRVLDRTARLLCVAARMALATVPRLAELQDAGDEVNTGLVCGTMFGSLHSIASFDWSGLEDGVNLVNPMDFPNTVINSAAGQAAIKFRLGGINSTICAAQASGLYAIQYAAEFLRLHRADLLLAGGAEELSTEAYLGFCKNGWLSNQAVPFSQQSTGMMLGEGAVMLAMQRGDSPSVALAEHAGFGATHDGGAAQTFAADAAGATEAIALALESAEIQAEDIACIISGASGSRSGDLMELHALRKAFGPRLKDIPLHTPKAALGETLGAGGAFAALCGALALKNQRLPPTFGGSRAELAISSKEQSFNGEYSLVTAFSCDGNNAALVLRRC